MVLHPGIIALLLGAALSFIIALYASILGLRILFSWELESSSEKQLVLERRTYLLSTLVNLVFGFSLFSGLLFLFTIDDIHVFFVGAMCATGTLNANPIGWWVLVSKIAIFFFASLWLIYNSLDAGCEDAPLVKLKYGVLPLLLLLLGGDLWLQILFFTGLEPHKITSCCGSLFGSDQGGVASELAGVAPIPMMWIFFIGSFLYLFTLYRCLKSKGRFIRLTLLGEAVVLLPITLVSIISFLSLYIYEMPTHHCPFDMIQKNYSYIGYPLYIGLFGGILYGMVPGISVFLPENTNLINMRDEREKKWLGKGILFYGTFFLISTGYMFFSDVMFFNY